MPKTSYPQVGDGRTVSHNTDKLGAAPPGMGPKIGDGRTQTSKQFSDSGWSSCYTGEKTIPTGSRTDGTTRGR